MRAALITLVGALCACEPQYITDIHQRQAEQARQATARLQQEASVTPEQRLQRCLDVEERSIIGRHMSDSAATDIVVNDCRPHLEVIGRNMSLAQYDTLIEQTKAKVIVDLVMAR